MPTKSCDRGEPADLPPPTGASEADCPIQGWGRYMSKQISYVVAPARAGKVLAMRRRKEMTPLPNI